MVAFVDELRTKQKDKNMSKKFKPLKCTKKGYKNLMKARHEQLETLNSMGGMPFAKPFPEWSKDHQLEYNALHEILYRASAKFEPVTEKDGVKYTEEEMETQRNKLACDYDM